MRKSIPIPQRIVLGCELPDILPWPELQNCWYLNLYQQPQLHSCFCGSQNSNLNSFRVHLQRSRFVCHNLRYIKFRVLAVLSRALIRVILFCYVFFLLRFCFMAVRSFFRGLCRSAAAQSGMIMTGPVRGAVLITASTSLARIRTTFFGSEFCSVNCFVKIEVKSLNWSQKEGKFCKHCLLMLMVKNSNWSLDNLWSFFKIIFE